MHLRYCLRGAYEAGITDHPQKVMEDLGITYHHATPQSIGDQWWFWSCGGKIDTLPSYLSELDIDPQKCIGFGLNKELADKITNYKK